MSSAPHFPSPPSYFAVHVGRNLVAYVNRPSRPTPIYVVFFGVFSTGHGDCCPVPGRRCSAGCWSWEADRYSALPCCRGPRFSAQNAHLGHSNPKFFSRVFFSSQPARPGFVAVVLLSHILSVGTDRPLYRTRRVHFSPAARSPTPVSAYCPKELGSCRPSQLSACLRPDVESVWVMSHIQ